MPILALVKDVYELQMLSRQVKLANNYSLLFLVPGNSRSQDKNQHHHHHHHHQQQNKEFILSRYGYSNIRSRCIFHCPFKNSLFEKTFSPLAMGFCLHKHRHRAILFSFLFEHFQSSTGSLPLQLNHLMFITAQQSQSVSASILRRPRARRSST